MVSSLGVTELIKNLGDLRDRLGLQQATNDHFFPEWLDNLPDLDEPEQAGIQRIKQRYDYHRLNGLLLEGTINLVVVSPSP